MLGVGEFIFGSTEVGEGIPMRSIQSRMTCSTFGKHNIASFVSNGSISDCLRN